MQPIFITGIGTGIGKTVVSAIVTEALQADYWKPIQAGFEDSTDEQVVGSLISNTVSTIHPEVYKLSLPASPHIAAREENITIDLHHIQQQCQQLARHNKQLVIEGAGGIMVPLNEQEFVADLILKLNAKVILVSRNYLGSINHSLLTASYCKAKGIDVMGWIFNDQYLHYEDEIVQWSGYKKLASIPFISNINKTIIHTEAIKLQTALL